MRSSVMDTEATIPDVFVVCVFKPALADKALPYPQTDVFSSWNNAMYRFHKLASRLQARGCMFNVHRGSEHEGVLLAMDTAQQMGVVLQRKCVNERACRATMFACAPACDDGDDRDDDDDDDDDGPL